jgi:Helix-turn-helix.
MSRNARINYEGFRYALNQWKGKRSYADLSDLSGVHRTYIWVLATGKRPPGLSAMVRLCKAMKRDIQEFAS